MVSRKEIPQEILESIEREALLNAVRHDGKADKKAVLGRVLGQHGSLRSDSAGTAALVGEVVDEVNAMSPEAQASTLDRKFPGSSVPEEKQGRSGLPPLKSATSGKAVFRLPPEPSGFMTIGHAMAFNINFLYKEMYHGKLWLRFEDTNPRKAAKKYYENFRRGIEWLGISCDAEKNVSDDVELLYGYGKKMVESGDAYACSCDPARVKALRFEGKACEHRDSTPAASLRIWDELISKKHPEGAFVIRFRGDLTSLDYSLRDPNIFRIIDHPHTLTGTKYTLWPTYDLANTIEDEICGVTHVLRSSEFHNDLQRHIRERLGLKPVEVVQFSRFNFKGTPVGKRLLRPLVEQGLVSGWDDPRMPTVDAVRRRGLLPEALRQFTLQVGYTKSEHEYDWSLLYAVNRKLLDPFSRRLFFVPEPVKVEISGAPEKEVVLRLHPDKDMGDRRIQTGGTFFLPGGDLAGMSSGAKFRLIDLYNVELTSAGEDAKARYAGDELIPDTKKLQWVTPDSIKVSVTVTGPLFDDNGEFEKSSIKEVEGLVEKSFSDLKVGDIVQFPRFGFCRLDSPGRLILAHR